MSYNLPKKVIFVSYIGGYNINDVMFYWTRGNESVSGLDTLQLAQYTVEDHYTSVSEAVYETGESLWVGFQIDATFADIRYIDKLSSLFSKAITQNWSSTLS